MLESFQWEKGSVARCAEMAEEVVGIASGSGGPPNSRKLRVELSESIELGGPGAGVV